MHRSATTAGLAALLLAAACAETFVARPKLASTAADMSVCCDPDAELPVKVGEFLVQIYKGEFADLDEDTLAATLTTTVLNPDATGARSHAPAIQVRLSVESGGSLELGSNTIEVFVDDCNFRRVLVDFHAEVLGRSRSSGGLEVTGLNRQFVVVNTCPPLVQPPSPPQVVVEQILGTAVSGFDAFAQEAPTGVPTRNSRSSIDPKVPDEAYTETFQVGGVVVELDQQRLDDAFLGTEPLFPLGMGEFGLTLQSRRPAPMTPGPYLMAWQCVAGDIPLDDETKSLQYTLVADRDADSSNNYRAQAPLEFDPFDDSDAWYTTTYNPFTGWSLRTVDASVFPPMDLPSAARVIFQEQMHFLVIPVAELGVLSELPARFTTLSHEGDFGRAGPWSADATAPVGEPRVLLSLQPSF